MSFDERLAASIDGAVSRADLPSGDARAAMALGTGLRRRRRRLSIGAVCATVGAVALVAAVWQPHPAGPGRPAGPTPPADSIAPRGGWTKAAASPLSPRYGPLMVWTGDEVLVMGGHEDPPCPAAASCVTQPAVLPDAAAYDPDADTWRRVAPAPTDVDRSSPALVVDGVVVLGSGRRWWTYDPGDDTWRSLPDPPDGSSGPQSALDGAVYTVDRQERVAVLDVAARRWSTLPPDPLQPPLEASVLATDAGIVLVGVNYEEAAPDEPTLTQADVWDGSTWRRLPRTGMIGSLSHWTGERLVGLEVGGADGGATNGWDAYYPSGGALDPATGSWEPVPGLPDDYDSPPPAGTWVVDAADGPLVASGGRVYDDRTQTWTPLGAPDSALDSELSATWADGRLVFSGGYDSRYGYDDDVIDEALANETWIWTPGAASGDTSVDTPDAPDTAIVPSVVGLTVRAAEQQLRSAGFEVEEQVVGCPPTDSCLAGTVTEVEPAAGTAVPAGSRVVVRHL